MMLLQLTRLKTLVLIVSMISKVLLKVCQQDIVDIEEILEAIINSDIKMRCTCTFSDDEKSTPKNSKC